MSADDEDGKTAGPVRPSPRTKLRIESLSDLVFGLALSIGSLVLVGKGVESGEDIAFNVLLFGFGFLIIVVTWLGYSRSMAVLPVEVPFALLTNIVLLFLVAVEPYLFYVLWSVQASALSDAATVAYALDIGGLSFTQAGLAYLVLRAEKAGSYLRHPPSPAVLARFRRVATRNTVLGVIWVVSALPVFWVSTPIGPLRYYLWAASFLLSLAGRASGKS